MPTKTHHKEKVSFEVSVPNGYQVVGYRRAVHGEHWISALGCVMTCTCTQTCDKYVIIEKLVDVVGNAEAESIDG